MKVAVKDANILIDLANGDLLELCLRLPYEFVTTDAVLLQLKYEPQWQAVRPFVENEVICIAPLSAKEQVLIQQDPRIVKFDFTDLGVLFVAEREKAILLTGDLPLRKESKKQGVRVHGLLWVMDQLIECRQLLPGAAAKSLRLILAQGARLPVDECKRRLREWGKE